MNRMAPGFPGRIGFHQSGAVRAGGFFWSAQAGDSMPFEDRGNLANQVFQVPGISWGRAGRHEPGDPGKHGNPRNHRKPGKTGDPGNAWQSQVKTVESLELGLG